MIKINASKFRRCKYDFIAIFIFFILLVVLFTFLQQSSYEWIFWKWDDSTHISGAFNLFHGQGYTQSFIYPSSNFTNYLNGWQSYLPMSYPIHEKGPVYSAILGFWLFIANAKAPNWYFYGQLLNLLLSFFAVLSYYYWIRKIFGSNFAFASALLLTLLSGFFWPASRVVTEPLYLFVFFNLSFYLISRKKEMFNLKFILFIGLITGLLHLLHATGLLVAVTILCYLLFNRQLLKSLYFLIIYISTLLPWMILNLLYYGDFTLGLGIPLPSTLKSFFSSLVTPMYTLPGSSSISSFSLLSPIDTLLGFLKRSSEYYNMSLFSILVIVLFLVELILFYKYGSKMVKEKTYLFFIIIYSFIVASFYYSLHLLLGLVPEARFVFPLIFMLIPIGLFGLHRFSKFRLKIKPFKKGVSIGLILFVILMLSTVASCYSAILSINAMQATGAESEGSAELHKWLRENVPPNSTIGTNAPHATYLRTGLFSIQFFNSLSGNISFIQNFVSHFSIDYFVFYGAGPSFNSYILNDKTVILKIFENEAGVIFICNENFQWRNNLTLNLNFSSFWTTGEGNGNLTVDNAPQWTNASEGKMLSVLLANGTSQVAYIKASFLEPIDISNFEFMIVPHLINSKSKVQIYLYTYDPVMEKSNYVFYVLTSSTDWVNDVFDLNDAQGVKENFNKSALTSIMICFIGGCPSIDYFRQIEFVNP